MGLQQQSRLLSLPDELLDIVLANVPLSAFLACQLTCKRLNHLSAESVLWRRHCLTQYRYWKPERSLDHLSQAPPGSVNWKKLLAERRQIDQSVATSIDGIISAQAGRLPKVEEILQHGYDAKDALLKHWDVDDSAEDALARRYWSLEALGCLERAAALEVWSKLDSGEDVPLERALGAFDLMIAQRPPETLDQISKHLDDLAEGFKIGTPLHEEMTPDVKARMLAGFLLGARITGGNIIGGSHSEQAFRRLKNTLISITLCDEEHPSIPIISVAIYCSVARRLGLDAHPCAYPVRVLAMVLLPNSHGESGDDNTPRQPLYLDVYDNVSVLPLSGLRQQLFTWGVPHHQHAEFLQPASNYQIVERNARNIQESLTVSHNYEFVLETTCADALRLLAPHKTPSELNPRSLRTTLNPDRANYAIGWYNIFSAAHRPHPNVLLVTLKHLGAAIREDFRFDVSQFQKYALPLFPPGEGPEQADYFAAQMVQMRREEAEPPAVQRRGADDTVAYRVGQVFQHRKYGYTAAITGWDTRCRASARWIQSMHVDSLPRGREQCFYHVLVDDGTMRYVAEENIDTESWRPDSGVVASEAPDAAEYPPPEALLWLAGKFFKRWDGRSRRFVSNVRDQYPDD